MAPRLGDYELIRKIGAGGMAEVWMGRRATGTGAAKAVAIKMMAHRFADEPTYEKMFWAEARLSMLLGHSNIVQVFDVGREGETAYLVMEWVDGLNLAQIASYFRKQGDVRLPVSVVGYVVGEILRALDYAHNLVHEGKPLRIVHRDVSPQNVLVSVSGEVKLTDFGVARLAIEETSGMHVKGKLRYMPREQLAGQSHHPGVDLYAVGAILHELLDGRKFRGQARTEVELAAMAAKPEIPPLSAPDVPWELEELRVALLQPDPAHRVQSAAQALQMLERWPGYRNAAVQLGALCRRIMGVDAPRSGLFDLAAVPGEASAVQTGAAGGTGAAGSLGPPRAPDPDGGRGDDSGRDTGTGSDLEASTLARRSGPPPMQVAAGLVLAALLVGSGVYLAMHRVGPAGGDVSGGAGTTEVGARQAGMGGAASGPSVGGEVSVSPGPGGAAADGQRGEGEVAGRGAVLRGVASGSEGAASGAPGEGRVGGGGAKGSVAGGRGEAVATDGAPEKAQGGGGAGVASSAGDPRTAKERASMSVDRRAKAARIPVRFSVGGGARLAYVRLDGRRVYVLEPLASVRLPEGTHRLEWRMGPDDPWRRGPRLVLRRGRSYRVRVGRDGPKVMEK